MLATETTKRTSTAEPKRGRANRYMSQTISLMSAKERPRHQVIPRSEQDPRTTSPIIVATSTSISTTSSTCKKVGKHQPNVVS